jgi:hypothetical protein
MEKLLPEETLLCRFFLPVKKFLPEELQEIRGCEKVSQPCFFRHFDLPLVH